MWLASAIYEKERIYKARDAGGKYHLLHPPRSLDYTARKR